MIRRDYPKCKHFLTEDPCEIRERKFRREKRDARNRENARASEFVSWRSHIRTSSFVHDDAFVLWASSEKGEKEKDRAIVGQREGKRTIDSYDEKFSRLSLSLEAVSSRYVLRNICRWTIVLKKQSNVTKANIDCAFVRSDTKKGSEYWKRVGCESNIDITPGSIIH